MDRHCLDKCVFNTNYCAARLHPPRRRYLLRLNTSSTEMTMPLWKVYHPVGAYTREDKHALSKRITDVYAEVPLPKFYVSGGINDTCEIHGCNRLSGQGPPSRDRRFESHFPAKSRANDGHRCDLVANSDPGLASLAEICARLGVSHRFLRKCCEQNLGISPARVPRSSGKTQVVWAASKKESSSAT